MNLWDNNLFARDLSNFIKIIEDCSVPIDTSKLHNLASQLVGKERHFIEIKDVVINISKKIAKTQPPGISKIAIYLSHTCEVDHAKDYMKNDPIKTYYFYFQINGYGVNSKQYINCWRLDQDIESAASKYTHPYYHFQAGGDELQYKDPGDLIMLSAPRLPHPPMDIFLGLHFILNNYLSTKDYPSVKMLFENYDYQQIIKRAQKRMWHSYFNSFHSSNEHLDYTFKRVFPLFLQD